MLRGILKNKRKAVKKLLEEAFDVILLENDVIESYCEVYSELRKRGELIPEADMLIAASAIAKKLKLVTKDRHFLRLGSLGLDVLYIEDLSQLAG